MIDLLDYYAAGWPYLFIAFVELIIVGHIYGVKNFLADIEHMIGFRPSPWQRSHLSVLYQTVSPLVILVILIISWADYSPLKKADYVYPDWANALGWIIAMAAILPVIFVAVGYSIHVLFFQLRDVEWNRVLGDYITVSAGFNESLGIEPITVDIG